MCLCEPLGETMLTGEFYSDSNPVTANMNLLQRPGPVHHIYVLYMRHFFFLPWDRYCAPPPIPLSHSAHE